MMLTTVRPPAASFLVSLPEHLVSGLERFRRPGGVDEQVK